MLTLLSVAAAITVVAGPPVTVTVTGVENDRGSVHVDICPKDSFATDRCPYSADAPARAGTTTVTVRGVPPGRYAAQGYHDADGNGRANRNFLGIPTERVGFSTDAPIRLGPPRFADAAFDHADRPQTITFRLRKLP